MNEYNRHLAQCRKEKIKVHKAILRFIVFYNKKYSIAPSLGEIAKHIGKSQTTASNRIDEIEEDGRITRKHCCPRTLVVKKDGHAFIGVQQFS